MYLTTQGVNPRQHPVKSELVSHLVHDNDRRVTLVVLEAYCIDDLLVRKLSGQSVNDQCLEKLQHCHQLPANSQKFMAGNYMYIYLTSGDGFSNAIK